MKNRLFFAPTCPDTQPFVQILQEKEIAYEEVNILENLQNLKEFIRLRDQNPAFDAAKEKGNLSIPALLTEEKLILDPKNL